MTAVIIVVLFSLGMFEAVGIQFGMDQMVEASSDQICCSSKCIHTLVLLEYEHWHWYSGNSDSMVWIMSLSSQCTLHVYSKHVQSDLEWLMYFAVTAEFRNNDL